MFDPVSVMRLVQTRPDSGPERASASPASRPELRPRQRQVLELLAEGVSAREIAGRLGLAEPTVRNHIRFLLRKLGCHSQLEAVAIAFRLDLLERGG